MKKASAKTKKVTAARKKYTEVKKTSKLGSGKRFSALQKSVEAEGYSPKKAAAIAAAAGRKAHGAKTMARLSAKGRKKGGK